MKQLWGKKILFLLAKVFKYDDEWWHSCQQIILELFFQELRINDPLKIKKNFVKHRWVNRHSNNSIYGTLTNIVQLITVQRYLIPKKTTTLSNLKIIELVVGTFLCAKCTDVMNWVHSIISKVPTKFFVYVWGMLCSGICLQNGRAFC